MRYLGLKEHDIYNLLLNSLKIHLCKECEQMGQSAKKLLTLVKSTESSLHYSHHLKSEL